MINGFPFQCPNKTKKYWKMNILLESIFLFDICFRMTKPFLTFKAEIFFFDRPVQAAIYY